MSHFGVDSRFVRIILTALVVIGLAWFLFTAVRDLIIYGLYFRYIDELAAKTGLNKYLVNVLAAVGIAPFVLGFKYYFFSLSRSKRSRGAALLLGMIVVYNSALYVATKDNVIGRFYAITPEGVRFSDRALDDGREWQKVTRDNMWYVTHLAVGKRVDAAGRDWFDQKSGLPLLWYSKLDNEVQFYDGPGYDRFTAEPLKAVTKDLYLEWKQSAQPRTPAPVPPPPPQSVAETTPEAPAATETSLAQPESPGSTLASLITMQSVVKGRLVVYFSIPASHQQVLRDFCRKELQPYPIVVETATSQRLSVGGLREDRSTGRVSRFRNGRAE